MERERAREKTWDLASGPTHTHTHLVSAHQHTGTYAHPLSRLGLTPPVDTLVAILALGGVPPRVWTAVLQSLPVRGRVHRRRTTTTLPLPYGHGLPLDYVRARARGTALEYHVLALVRRYSHTSRRCGYETGGPHVPGLEASWQRGGPWSPTKQGPDYPHIVRTLPPAAAMISFPGHRRTARLAPYHGTKPLPHIFQTCA